MVKFGLPKCPSCGKKINWFRAWALKTQGEFRCGKCGACSNVVIDRLLYVLSFLAAGASAVLFLVFVAFVREYHFTALIWVVIPFFLFFTISPFFVRLRPPAQRREPAVRTQRRVSDPRSQQIIQEREPSTTPLVAREPSPPPTRQNAPPPRAPSPDGRPPRNPGNRRVL